MDILSNPIQKSQLHLYPFKHILIPNFFTDTFVIPLKKDIEVLEKSGNFRSYKSNFGEKREWKIFPEELEALHILEKFLGSQDLIDALSKVFSLPTESKLSLDNTYDGGGYVISPPNSFLGYHADFNYSSAIKKYRILNILYYFNENYQSNFGGHLHLLDAESKTVEKIVKPEFNTLLAFLTDDVSFHGVSRNSNEFSRRSFNIYYYSDQPLSPNQSLEPHKTLWVKDDSHHH